MATISFDYESILNRLRNNLSTKSEHSDILYFGANAKILESISQESAYEMQYDEYLTRENWWDLARNSSSLLVMSPMHGYKVPRKIGATGTLKVGTSEDFDTPPINIVNIPKYTEFSNGETFFVATNDYQISTSSNYIEINVKQGKAQSNTFTALGNPFETYLIENNAVENSLFDLYVNGVLWEEVNYLFDYSGEDLVYEIRTLPDFSGIEIKAGNGTFGKQFQTGDTVTLQYIETLGIDGNVEATDNVTTVESVVYDTTGLAVDLFCTNESSLSGGRNEATLEEIREASPKVYQTGDRATSKDDYKFIIQNFDYVNKTNVWGAYEYLEDNDLSPFTYISSEENLVHLAVLNTSNENLSTAQQLQVIEDINEIKSPTDLLFFETVRFVYLNFVIDAYLLNSSYTIPDVIGDIEQALLDTYSIDYTNFEENIYNSDFQRLVDEVTGVKYHDSYIEVFEFDSFTETYVCAFNLPILPFTPDTFSIYIKEVGQSDDEYILVGTSDSSGTIIAESGYDLTGTSLDINTGIGTLVVESGLTEGYDDYVIKFVYQPITESSKNLLLPNRYSIFRYYNSTISASYASI